VNIGILGYGTIAGEHARALVRAGCNLVAVAGPDPDSAAAFAREHGVARVAPSVDAVVRAGDVEALVIASPNAMHPEQAILGLTHGKHVLCEVPLALSLADAERVADVSRSSDLQMMVCQTQRFLRPVAWIRDDLARRRVRHIVIRLVLNRTTNVGLTGKPRSWTDDLVWHHGSHAVDTALWLLGEATPDSVALAAGESATGSPLDAGIVLRSGSGAIVTLALSYSAQGASTDLMVVCDDRSYRYEHGVLTSSDGMRESHDEASVFVDAVRRQDAAFVEAVSTGSAASPTPAELSAVYRTLQRVSDEIRGRAPAAPTP
jgi:2-hydroxy-4-carboxymuconate semialdehyde hemiacetal dehydrogenase